MSLYTQTVQEELFQLSSLYFLLRWLEAETQKATSQFVSASISSGKADAGDGLLILSRAAQPNCPADANSLATEACSAALPQSGIPESLSEMKTADIFCAFHLHSMAMANEMCENLRGQSETAVCSKCMHRQVQEQCCQVTIPYSQATRDYDSGEREKE